MSKSLDKELAGTLRAIRGIKARSPDELEDYFHDAIAKALEQGKTLDDWMAYFYRSVSLRVACGQEGRMYLPLDESLVPDTLTINLDLKLDIKKALSYLSPLRRQYIYEYFYEGRTLDEIAEKHGVSNQVVSKVIRRALGVMRVALKV